MTMDTPPFQFIQAAAYLSIMVLPERHPVISGEPAAALGLPAPCSSVWIHLLFSIILLSPCRQDSSRQSTCRGTRSASTAPRAPAGPPPSCPGSSTAAPWTGGWSPPTSPPPRPPASRAPPSPSTSSCCRSTSGPGAGRGRARPGSCGPPASQTCPASRAWRYPWSAPCCWAASLAGTSHTNKSTMIISSYHRCQVAVPPRRLGSS